MSGLREKQKADRDRRILQAASKLFHQVGYEKSKIEDIAGLAEVSTGTVYNYYQNKGDLLVAIVSMEVNEVLNAGAELIADQPSDAEAAINALIAIYLDHSLIYLNKEMWRHAMAITTRQPHSPYGRRYNDLDARLAAQVCELIEGLRQRGRVAADIDSRGVGEMIFNNTNMMFINFVKDETMPLAALKAGIARQNRTLARAIRTTTNS